MFLTIWNYLRGYVIIEVYGFSVERFINLAAHKGIYFWDVSRAAEAATMKVSVKAFRLLKPCAKKTKCKIKIIGKQGMPFVAHRYRKRKFLAFGLVFFVAALYFLSSFIWHINIEGTDRIHNEDLLAFLDEQGFATGTFKSTVNRKGLESDLLIHFPDISWVNIGIKGTRATIRLTETIPKQGIIDNSVPSDIVAKKDGLITSIATSAGTPMVKPGDVVEAGDVLVSGELKIGNEDTGIRTAYVQAKSDVRAKMYYKINFEVPLQYTEKSFTGNSKKYYSIILFDHRFTLLNDDAPYVNFEKVVSRNQLEFGSDYPLPIVIGSDEYKEFTPVTVTRTIEQAEHFGDELVTSRIIREFDVEADIIDKKISFTEQENSVKVEAFITTVERIDEQRVIAPEIYQIPQEIPTDLRDGSGTIPADIEN